MREKQHRQAVDDAEAKHRRQHLGHCIGVADDSILLRQHHAGIDRDKEETDQFEQDVA